MTSLAGLPAGTTVALHLSGLAEDGVRWWWGDTFQFAGESLRPLVETSS